VTEVYELSATDGANVDLAKLGMPENVARSLTNDALRGLEGAIRRWYADPEWLDLFRDYSGPYTVSRVSDTVFRVVGNDVTAQATAGRRVRMEPGSVEAFIVSSAFGGSDTDVTVEEGAVPAGLTSVVLHHSRALGKLAFSDSAATGFYLPATADDEGIQAAIDDASAAGGGVVLLGDASYAIDAKVTVKAGVALWGAASRAASLVADATLNDSVVELEGSCSLVGATIDCASMTNTHDAVKITGGDALIQSCFIREPTQSGVYIGDTGISRVTVRSLYVDTPGTHGVHVDDAGSNLDALTFDDVVVDHPGATVNAAAGLFLAGRFHASNLRVTCNRASPSAQRGVWLATKNASGLTSARDGVVRGFLVTGTGDAARGIDIAGTHCIVTDGVVRLSGSASLGVIVDSTGAGQVSDWNQVRGVSVEGAATGLLLQADAYDNLASGVVVEAAQTVGIEERGRRSQLLGCTVDGSSGDGLDVLSSSEDVLVRDLCVRNITGTSVQVDASATRPDVRDLGGDYPDLSSPGLGIAARERIFHLKDGDTQRLTSGGLSEFEIGLSNIGFPTPVNGLSRFLVRLNAVWSWTNIGGGSFSSIYFKIRMGPNGDISDPVILEETDSSPGGSGSDHTFRFGAVNPDEPRDVWVQPSATDRLTVTVGWSASNAALNIRGDTSQPGKETYLEIEKVADY